MKIVNTKNLRVKQLSLNKYLIWTSVVFILFVPKVIFEFNDNGQVKKTNVVGFAKSVFFNFIFIFGTLLVYLFIENLNFSQIYEFIPLLIGTLVFLVLVNFIIIETTKSLAKKQIE